MEPVQCDMSVKYSLSPQDSLAAKAIALYLLPPPCKSAMIVSVQTKRERGGGGGMIRGHKYNSNINLFSHICQEDTFSYECCLHWKVKFNKYLK